MDAKAAASATLLIWHVGNKKKKNLNQAAVGSLFLYT